MTSSLEGGGRSGYPPKVMTSFSHDMMTRGRGGSGYPPKVMTSFMNSPLFTFCDNWKLRRGSELRLMKDRNLLVFSAFTKEFLMLVKYIENQQPQYEYSSRDTQQKALLTCPSFPAFGYFVEGENSILLNTRLLDLKRIIAVFGSMSLFCKYSCNFNSL